LQGEDTLPGETGGNACNDSAVFRPLSRVASDEPRGDRAARGGDDGHRAECTQLAQAPGITASIRAAHPTWAAVPWRAGDRQDLDGALPGSRLPGAYHRPIDRAADGADSGIVRGGPAAGSVSDCVGGRGSGGGGPRAQQEQYHTATRTVG